MSSLLQVCLYNQDEASAGDLRTQISNLNFVRVVAETSTTEALATALEEGGINLVFFNLDPNRQAVLEIIEQVAGRFPELAMIAMSEDTAPDAILAPIRAGCDQFVCKPIDADDLANAVGRVASKRLLSRGKSRCVCVVGASGGVGTTSIACNLGMELAHLTEKRCALVDLDLQFGDLAVNFDTDPRYTIFDLASAGSGLDRTVMESVLTELPCDVWLLARPENVDHHSAVTSETAHRAIELLSMMFETVIVDLPRRVDASSFAAANQADLILVVCQLVVPSIRNTKRYIDAMVHQGISPERMEVVVNRGDSSGGRIRKNDLEELIKKPIYASIPNDYQFVARSIDFGKPIASLDEKNPVRVAIRKMAQEIISGGTPAAKSDEGRRGFFSKLLSK